MLAEKKALKRFLLIYILSTTLLIAIGEFFYYQLAKNNLIQKEKLILKNQITTFLNLNPFLIRAIRLHEFKIPKNTRILIYFNNNLIFSNSPILDLKVEHIEIKRWGRIKIITTAPFPKEKLKQTIKYLIIFNLFFIIFITIVAIFLGKLFLEPLKKSIQNLENFIRDATHEMNTPISIILANIELLDTKSKPIKRIKNAAIRLNKIFEDLKYVRLYHKRKKEKKKIELSEFLKERLALFEDIIENRNLTLQLNIQKTLLTIDKEDLTRLFDNLLSNALKYAPNNSTIKITLNKDFFCIENEGEIKNIEKITQKFYRENQSQGGFGLGLYIVKKIADEYSFKLTIKNKNKIVKICLNLVK